MQITSIEAIRGNPVLGNPVAVGVLAGEKLPVAVGDTVRVHMTVDHRGDDLDGAIWTAIGWQVGIIIPEFIEVFNSRTPVHFDRSEDYVTYPIVCDVEITDISGFLIEFGLYGNILDMYAKIMEVPGPDIFTPIYNGVIEVVEVAPPPEYELVYHHEYPQGKTYVGKAEECTATLTIPLPDQLFPNSWVIEKIADAFANEVAKEGGEMLDIKIYEDATPTWHTDYKIVATAIASPLPWTPIILLILAIILVLAFINLVVQFKDIDWGEIPPAIPWAILALAGGIGILGVGAAVALAAPKPRE
ncbi:hypothetical protein ES703_44223 [subsurface metagenome]